MIENTEVQEVITEEVAQEQSVNDTVIENMDNRTLANVVADKLEYDFATLILVKPLPVEMTYKTLTVPEDSGEKSEDGEAIMQMTIKEVETESLFRKGVVLSIPLSLQKLKENGTSTGIDYTIGDTIVYPSKRSMDFDLFKDSALVAPFEVIAKTK